MPCITEQPSDSQEQYYIKMLLKSLYLINYKQRNDLFENRSFIENIHKFNYQKLLCLICKFLNKEQLISVDVSDGYIGLYQWYKQHVLIDFSENYENEDERNICLSEAKRLGWVLEYENGSSSIK